MSKCISFIIMVASGIVFTGASASLHAAQPYNDAQLRLLFNGSSVVADGHVCGGFQADELWNIKFGTDGTFTVQRECNGFVSDAYKGVDDSGRWMASNGQLCFEHNNTVNADGCWSVAPSRFGFDAMPSNGMPWNLSFEHPKYSTRDSLVAALKEVKETETAEAVTVPKGMSVSRAAKDSATWEAIKYSNNVSDFQRYLAQYPNGLFAALAENQIRDLIKREANPGAVKNEFAGIEFGAYHALVIGINNYKYITNLGTAVKDARAVASVLEQDYGFEVQLLIDPDRADIVDAFDEYRENLTEEDNFLIYYAGHGWLDEQAEEGYWLTAKAKSNRRSQWVSNATITKTLKTMPAKHVMVVADSCYSGTLTRAASVGFRDKNYFKRMARKKARVALVSGGLEPVADDAGGGNSPFARAFIDALKKNDSVIDGTRLLTQIRRPVILNAQQTPEYSDVRNADHDGGDFLFVRKTP